PARGGAAQAQASAQAPVQAHSQTPEAALLAERERSPQPAAREAQQAKAPAAPRAAAAPAAAAEPGERGAEAGEPPAPAAEATKGCYRLRDDEAAQFLAGLFDDQPDGAAASAAASAADADADDDMDEGDLAPWEIDAESELRERQTIAGRSARVE